MELGEYIRQHRLENKWEVRDLARASGLAVSQISRIENNQSQLTLAAAVSLCYGLGLQLSDLIAVIGFGKFSVKDQKTQEETGILQLKDIEAFNIYYRSHFSLAKELLYEAYAKVLRTHPNKTELDSIKEAAEQIQEATRSFSSQIVPLPYPEKFPPDALDYIYRSGGVITLPDVGHYVRQIRQKDEYRLSLRNLAQKAGVGRDALSGIETGAAERLLFSDILAIDQALDQSGNITQMYWYAGEFHIGILRNRIRDWEEKPPLAWGDDEFALADTLVKISRWHEAVFPGEQGWLQSIRGAAAPYYSTLQVNFDNDLFVLTGDLSDPQVKRALAAYAVQMLVPHLSIITLKGSAGKTLLQHVPEQVKSLWALLTTYAADRPAFREIIGDLTESPLDEDLPVVLRVQIRKALWKDDQFGADLQKLVASHYRDLSGSKPGS